MKSTRKKNQTIFVQGPKKKSHENFFPASLSVVL